MVYLIFINGFLMMLLLVAYFSGIRESVKTKLFGGVALCYILFGVFTTFFSCQFEFLPVNAVCENSTNIFVSIFFSVSFVLFLASKISKAR